MSPNPSTENEIIVANVSDLAMREETQQVEDTGMYAKFSSVVLITIPAFGKIYTLFSSKFVFLASLLIFEIESVVCATLPNSPDFILGRALAGLGSAGIQAGTTLILAECVPLRQRPTWNSIIGSIFAVGSVAGPLSSREGLSQTPRHGVGVFTSICRNYFHRFLYEGSRGRKNISNSTGFSSQVARFDLAGTFTFMSATISLPLALSWCGTTYTWGITRIVALLTLAGVLFCSFFGIEYRMKDSAIIPSRLLRRRSIIAAIWFASVFEGALVSISPSCLCHQVFHSVHSIHNQCRWRIYVCWLWTAATGYYTPFVYAGSIIMPISTGLLMAVQPQYNSRAKWVRFQILIGAGVGLGEEQGLYMVQTTLPEIDVATGIGIILFAQIFGVALFVPVAQEIFLENISKALRTLAPNLDPHSVLDGAMTAFPGDYSTETSAELQSVYGVATKEALRVGLLLATISIVGALMYDWKSLKTKHNKRSDERNSDNKLDQFAGV
ncbi:uncharacterized protein EAE98_005875 [Botrytis deweyae]|uniref:Major facilitator superfamily (MFS) profile domain-containing protein n=1 Tax=Botrytis deweyae TaxID=2478750 RepID=A0ABQ7IL13_9HELO|nr:uncharacterized protein EAE98_005875 [Botrytis deweyae]KAF7927493.1 hypothetical protein EAE98_005875 [Botrytis deweyae]